MLFFKQIFKELQWHENDTTKKITETTPREIIQPTQYAIPDHILFVLVLQLSKLQQLIILTGEKKVLVQHEHNCFCPFCPFVLSVPYTSVLNTYYAVICECVSVRTLTKTQKRSAETSHLSNSSRRHVLTRWSTTAVMFVGSVMIWWR